MAVRFILGRSGSGKTGYCITSVVEHLLSQPEKNAFLLVPEQATYLAEKAILSGRKIAGYFSPPLTAKISAASLPSLNVLSFDRLVFLLLGKNSAKRQISKLGRQMIIRRILEQQQQKLQLFAGSAVSSGLCQKISQTIAELQQYAKGPADIDDLVKKLAEKENDNLASMKFADIALIFIQYLSFIEGRFLDPDVQLNLAVGAIERSDALKDSSLWVDGFAGFTGVELAILTQLMRVAADIQIALCLDPDQIDRKIDESGNLFTPTLRTYHQLIEIIQKCKLKLDKPVILKDNLRFCGSPVLSHIERNVFKINSSRIAASDNIRIVQVSNTRAEVQFVAKQILQLVRRKSLRYRDIAVIAPDLSVYEHYIRAYFDDYNIPFFIDSRKFLRYHPAVCFILSALRAAIEDFSNSDIFDYLKSGFAPVSIDDVDLLENYCLAFGIKGSDWSQENDWNFADFDKSLFDLDRINQIRRTAIEPLLRLRQKLCPKAVASGKICPEIFTKVLFDFLDELNFNQKIGRLIEDSASGGDFEQADEHRQLYDALLDIFDELCQAFDGTQISCIDYLSIVTAAFSQMTLALIPPTLDQVLVGSIERSRHPDLKAVFLIGLTARDFPAPAVSGTVFSDQDRTAAESAGFQIAPTSFSALYDSYYLAYIAFTRASEFLFISFPLHDQKDRPVLRSRFIDEIENLFENLKPQSFALNQPAVALAGTELLEHIYTENDLSSFLCSNAANDPTVASLPDSLRKIDLFAKAGSLAASAIGYNNIARLDKPVVSSLFTDPFKCSPSRLETFAKCPYKFFARYILALEQRKEYKFEPLDLGIFYHRVLDNLFRYLRQQNIGFENISDSQLIETVEKIITQVIENDSYIRGFYRHSRHNIYILVSACKTLQDCVRSISQMIRAGRFRPLFTEVPFGNSADLLGQFQIPLQKGRSVFLNGKIDRIDLAELNESSTAAVVFDYKRKSNSFSWSYFFYGLDLQLAIYMLAVQNWGRSQPAGCDIAGAFYIPVETASQSAYSDENENQNSPPVLGRKASGLFNGSFADYLEENVAGSSRFYNFYVKDGQPYGHYHNRGALKPDDFDKVLKFAQNKAIALAGQILSGKIDVTPYRLGNDVACSTCDYRAVCRFDWQVNDYSYLSSKSKQEFLDTV